MKCGTNQKTCERLTATGYFENCRAQTHMATNQQFSKMRVLLTWQCFRLCQNPLPSE